MSSVSFGFVLIEAHRGASAIAPENTLASIAHAEGDADLTEFDVRETADGRLILMHDSTVDRTTNGSGPVSSLTSSQLESLDAGSWFSAAFAGERIPTMIEAMDFAFSVGISPLVERKSGAAQSYHTEFNSLGIDATTFRVISFDWNFLSDLDALNSDYNLGALGSGTINQSVINSVKASGADFMDWGHAAINQSAVDLVHANGLELHAWTVDVPSRMQQLIDLGVDGITTNRPATLRQLVIDTPEWADLDGDGALDAEDWLIYNNGRGRDLSALSYAEAHAMGDLDYDRDNDVLDFLRFKRYYSETHGAAAFAALLSVPEPTSLGILLVGLAAVHLMVNRSVRNL